MQKKGEFIKKFTNIMNTLSNIQKNRKSYKSCAVFIIYEQKSIFV